MERISASVKRQPDCESPVAHVEVARCRRHYTCVFQLFAPYTICALPGCTGATAATEGSSAIGAGILEIQSGRIAAAGAHAGSGGGAGQHDEQIAAHGRDGLLDHDLRALADRQHQNDRAHADHHAEHRQESAKLVGRHCARRLRGACW